MYNIVINALMFKMIKSHLLIPFLLFKPNIVPNSGSKHIEMMTTLPNEPKETLLIINENKTINNPKHVVEIKL